MRKEGKKMKTKGEMGEFPRRPTAFAATTVAAAAAMDPRAVAANLPRMHLSPFSLRFGSSKMPCCGWRSYSGHTTYRRLPPFP